MNDSLAITHPELIAEWSEKNKLLTPDQVTHGSSKIVWWKCNLGHEWQASVKNRAANHTSCPYCSHNKVLKGFNDLATRFPKLAEEWSEKNMPLLPSQVTAFANRKAWWKCKKCGYEWNTLISIRSSGSGCPCCKGSVLVKGVNDLSTTQPKLAQEWSIRNFPLTPDLVNEKSRKNVWWKCKECGYEWKSVIQTRVRGSMCPVCSNRVVLQGYNDLGTTDSYLLTEWDYDKNKDISPSAVTRNSSQIVWWRCSLGHSWKEKIIERTMKGKGCKICEKEYLTIFPKLAVMYYAGKKGLSVQTNYDKGIGIPLEIYIPEERVAIETSTESKKIELLKNHLCEKRNIKRLLVPYEIGDDEITFAARIKKALHGVHIFITSDERQDIRVIRKKYFEWREKTRSE